MKSIYESKAYNDEIHLVVQKLNIEFFSNARFLITGATGLICSYLIDLLLFSRSFKGTIYAVTTNLNKAELRFSIFKNDPRLVFVIQNIKNPIELNADVDYIIHGASYTDPLGYSAHPIDTMLINFCGMKNVLEFSQNKNAKVMLLSSCEIYGFSSKDVLKESDYGYIDSMEVRSCYNESKKAAETLCISFSYEKDVFVVIPRFSRCFGPTMQITDTKALSQFLIYGLRHKDVVLKSDGLQEFSYMYVSDAASSILFLLEKGQNREAYNVTTSEIIALRDMAQNVANLASCNLIFQKNDDFQGKGYSKAQRALQDISKIEKLGWSASVSILHGLEATLKILKEIY